MTDKMPEVIHANAFNDWMYNPRKTEEPIGFRTTEYTRTDIAEKRIAELEAQVLQRDTLLEEANKAKSELADSLRFCVKKILKINGECNVTVISNGRRMVWLQVITTKNCSP